MRDIFKQTMAKAIGLHRIIGHISEAKEKHFRRNENNQNVTQTSVIKEIAKDSPTCATPSCEDRGNKRPKLTHEISPSTTVISVPKPKNLIFCKGITCNQQNS